MRKYDDIIIGFGKGGKTLAATLAKSGRKTALIERSEKMYGGTCINVACIPTKSLENSARLSAAMGGDFTAKAARYSAAVDEKRRLTAMLRKKNYDKVASAGVDIIDGEAYFTGQNSINVKLAGGEEESFEAERFYINTGSVPFVPGIEGLRESAHVYTSESLMERDDLPERLVIIGGGYIGLEFSSYFTNFGSKVTVIQDGEKFIPREDGEIAGAVLKNLEERGITVMRSAAVKSVRDEGAHAVVTVDTAEGTSNIEADAILVATGRRPNVAGLNAAAAGVELTERGAIKADEHLKTTAPNIWVMGDAAGGLQFTYISLDDFRIVKDDVLGKGARTTSNRGAVPYSVFIDPPLSRVGMTEDEARAKGFNVKTATMPAATVPKAHVLKKPAGVLKAVVDGDTGLILGAHFFCAESQEMINTVKLAMDAGIPYTVLRDNIYTHPTMSEAMNDLFAMI